MKEPQPHQSWTHQINASAWLTIIGIVLLFTCSIVVVLLAPSYVDSSWTQPTSPYQVQMYEISDPNLYIGSTTKGSSDLQFVYHLKENFSLLAFHETSVVKIVSPPELEKYVTRFGDPILKLTSRLLMLRTPQSNPDFDAATKAAQLRTQYQAEWEKKHPKWKEEDLLRPDFQILELYRPEGIEAFANAPVDGIIENWVDKDFVILDKSEQSAYHHSPGVIYINNPVEYRVSHYTFGRTEGWKFDPKGERMKNLNELISHPLGFRSRADLIKLGEHFFAIEGCWYCHTDQTRTLIQDVVLNGSAEYPAPPSSANEYIYQKITFPGTRRIGPDLSRTGVKRPSRDWHKGHFWSPKTASLGSIMPSFRHFFDYDPRGSAPTHVGIPNYKFEAIYQYLMTKGTRITPPTEAWWLGKDPVNTKALIEGKRKIP
jgi:cytochrome c oxidase cbb3-type subunit 2